MRLCIRLDETESADIEEFCRVFAQSKQEWARLVILDAVYKRRRPSLYEVERIKAESKEAAKRDTLYGEETVEDADVLFDEGEKQ